MSLSYEDLHSNLRHAADVASTALHPVDEVNDLLQAANHLRDAVDMLDDVDVEASELPGPDAVLSKAAAIADEVHGQAIDLTNDANDELAALSDAVDAVNKAGYIGEAPMLTWFNGDVPDDGSSFD